MTAETLIPKLLIAAWLLPLLGFAVEVVAKYWQKNRRSKAAAGLAIFCIGTGFVLSATALAMGIDWSTILASEGNAHHVASTEHQEAGAPRTHDAPTSGSAHVQLPLAGTIYCLARFGDLEISIDYYIDSLTLVMFTMVTLVALCIHIFAVGYMSDELTDDHVDHLVHTPNGSHLHRPGRFYLFFAYFSLFSFSMLGLVLAGNIFMVFVFWELVGICSYLLIGFYVERHSASTAANKAFIVNRVGDFGFIVGLMIIWSSFGTFRFANYQPADGGPLKPGLFQMLRGSEGQPKAGEIDEENGVVYLRDVDGRRLAEKASTGGPTTVPYWLLVAAGLGVFAGCVGKSAQFPLQTWLPDAMEGPTPVSALVHSATMVAAGVYLAGRFFPMFTPEVLLTIAYVGCITLFLAATIAVVATDIKRVLAYSTISQLGYMMLGIGVAGWAAGLFHLITHAFFKSLLFLGSGSVIIACHHEQDMRRMGGLLKKMPITGLTFLIATIAISGLAIPGLIAFSGYYSKDAIMASALAYTQQNGSHVLLFVVPLITAGLTAFYMFRLWFSTFTGPPRDEELYEHVHETPWVMTGPLVVLAFFAMFVAAGGQEGPLYRLLLQSEPVGLAEGVASAGHAVSVTLPSHEMAHSAHAAAGAQALLAAVVGTLLAYFLYCRPLIDPEEIRKQISGVHSFLVNKWYFDELYDALFVRPVHVVARFVAKIDRYVLDGFLHFVCSLGVTTSRLDRLFDEGVVDGAVNLIADVIHECGATLRLLQTGRLRQYVLFIAVSVVTLFVMLYIFFPK